MRTKNHERLMLARRRTGMNQLEAARLLGLNYRDYLRLEQGPVTAAEYWGALDRFGLGPHPMTAGERCLLMRLRSGKTQREVAQELGCCRRWVMLMEKGLAPADDLVWYWEQ